MKWNNRYIPSATTLLLLATLGLSTPHALQAQVPTWNAATGGNWSDGTKWSGGTAPTASATALTFNAAAASYTATNNLGAVTLNSLTFDGTTIIPASGGTSANITLTNASGSSLAFASGATITNLGARANTTASPGIVGTLPAFALNGPVTFSTQSFNGVNLNGVISGTGDITKFGSGNLTIGNVANTFTGNWIIGTPTSAGGAIDFQGSTSTSAGNLANDFIINQGTLQYRNDVTTTGRDLTINATGTQTAAIVMNGNASQTSSFNSFVHNGGNLSITAGRFGTPSGAVTHTFDESFTLGGGTSGVTGNFTVAAAGSSGAPTTLNVNTVIDDGAAVYNFVRGNGQGIVLLSQANTYGGNNVFGSGASSATANFGITRLGVNNALGTTGTTSFANLPGSAVLDLNGFSQTLNNLASPIDGVVSSVTVAANSKVIDNQSATNSTLTLNSSANTNFYGLIRDTGTGVTNVVKTGTSQVSFFGDNDYDGTTTINAGTINLSFTNASGSAPAYSGDLGSTVGGTVITSASSPTLGGRLLITNTTGAPVTINENLTIQGSGTVAGDSALKVGSTTNGDVTIANTINVSAQATGVNNSIANDSTSAALNLNDITGDTGSNLVFRGAGTINANGVISGITNPVATLSGTLNLGNSNTFVNQFQVNSGVVNAATWVNAGTASSFGTGTTNSNIRIGNSANSGTINYTGAATSTDRGIVVGSNAGTPSATDTGGAIINNTGTGTLTFTKPAFNTTSGGTTAAGANRTLTFGGTSNIVVNGAIINNTASATVALVKNDSNKLTLGGTSTFSGGTNVNAGTLEVVNTSGSATGAGALTVASGATLSGDGAVGSASSAVLVNGTIQVGATGATVGSDLSIGSGVSTTLGAPSIVLLDLFSATGTSTLSEADRLVFTGAVNIDPAASLVIANPNGLVFDGSAMTQVFRVFDWSGVTGGAPTGTFGTVDTSALTLAAGSSVDLSNLYTAGTISIIGAVPEPSRMALVGLGVAGMAFRRRRKQA